MAALPEVRRFLVEIARRHSRVGHEAEDLAHDILLAALRRRLPLDGEPFLRSAHRAAQLHGAFLARSAGRRRARETRAAAEHLDREHLGAPEDVASGTLPSTLSPEPVVGPRKKGRPC